MSYAILFSISGALIVVVFGPLLYFIISRGRTLITKIFALHILTIIIWGITASITVLMQTPDLASRIWRAGVSSVPFMPAFLYHAVYLMRNEKNKLLLYLVYAQATFFSYTILIGKMHPTTKLMFGFYYGQGGALYLPSFTIWLLLIIISHLKLIDLYRKIYPQQKKQILMLSLGIPIGFGGGAMNWLPGFGINIFPFGNFLVPIYGLILAYAVLKHQLLDIDFVLRKSFVYSVLIALISLLYLLTIFLLEKFAQGVFGYRSLTISIFTAFGFGLIFMPLRRRIQHFTDRYFFKGTQEEIVQQNVQLRQEIAQSEKYKTLSTLASGIAHEIKNPLTSIKTFCEYLPRRLDDKEFLKKFARLIGHEVDRMDNMVHELLDYSKPAPLALKKTDINKLIEDTLNTLNSQFIKNHIEVTLEPSVVRRQSSDSCLLNIDANRVKQVLLNLFLNAIDAMPHGGKLTVATTIHHSLFTIHIKDTGSGIAPEDLKHIFDPFFSRKDHGTGLGLAIVQGIVEQHGGKVRITSQVGGGTEVKLEFPCPILDS